jgi:hypothetical protein
MKHGDPLSPRCTVLRHFRKVDKRLPDHGPASPDRLRG